MADARAKPRNIDFFAFIQDIGLAWFAIGALAVGAGLYRWRLGGLAWKLGSGLLGALAATLLILTVHEQYAKIVPRGLVIHDSLVYTIGIVFGAIALLTARGFGRVHAHWTRVSLTTAPLWIVAAPLLFLVPRKWDGAYERAVALLMVLWLGVAAALLIRSRPRAPSAGAR